MQSSTKNRRTAPWAIIICVLCCGVSSLPARLRSTPHAPAGARNKRIAVLVSGLQRSFLLASKLSQIVPPSLAEGYDVDFYIKLVMNSSGTRWRSSKYRNLLFEPMFRNKTQPRKYASTLEAAVRGAGAGLRYFELMANEEKIELPSREGKEKRLTQYDPSTSPDGQNLLRRYKSIQELAQLAVGQFEYSFVIVTRDDDHFLGKLNVSRFTGFANYSNRVFSKGCKTFGGINDKTLVFGSAAANRTLLRLYSDFWMDDVRLNAQNAEIFLLNFVRLNGAVPTKVSLGDIPSADSMWAMGDEGRPALCQKASYLCYDPKDWPPPGVNFWQRLDRPDACRNMALKKHPWDK